MCQTYNTHVECWCKQISLVSLVQTWLIGYHKGFPDHVNLSDVCRGDKNIIIYFCGLPSRALNWIQFEFELTTDPAHKGQTLYAIMSLVVKWLVEQLLVWQLLCYAQAGS